jgi:hypothetical protein
MHLQCLTRLCACVPQSDINDKMRAILIDWLVEVHLKFKVPLPPSLTHNVWTECPLDAAPMLLCASTDLDAA